MLLVFWLNFSLAFCVISCRIGCIRLQLAGIVQTASDKAGPVDMFRASSRDIEDSCLGSMLKDKVVLRSIHLAEDDKHEVVE